MGTMWGASFGTNGKEDDKTYDTVVLLILFVGLGGTLVGRLMFGDMILGFLVVAIAILVFLLVYKAIQQLIQGAITYQIKKGFQPKEASQVVILSFGLGICLALLSVVSLTYIEDTRGSLGEQIAVVLLTIAPVLTVTFLLGKLLIYSQFKRNRLIAQYFNNQQNLIKP